MSKHKIKKFISIMLILTLTGTMISCSATNLVPLNAVKPVVTPAVPITNFSVVSKNSSNDFSMQSLESKVNDIVATKENTQQNKELQEAYSGECGNNAHWNLNTGTGLLTIFGSGRMDDYEYVRHYATEWFTMPWWDYRSSIKTVDIRDGITYIGKASFGSCWSGQFDNLNTVIIPSSVQGIGESAFDGCPNLNAITLNNDYAVANFRSNFEKGYAKTTTATLGEGITEIPENAFMGCEKLKSITVPSSVISIGNTAFSFCESLTDFTYLGTNSPTTASNAFADCSLTGIKVTSKYLDTECCGLPITSITGNCGSNLNWELQPSTGALVVSGSGQMINYTDNSPASWNKFKSNIKSVNIGYGATSIGNNAFISCDNLVSVVLPSTLTSIGNSAFSGCENLKTLSLSDAISAIGSNAFSSCKKLSSVSFYGRTEPTNDKTAFSQCDSLVEVTVPTTYNKDTFCGVSVAKTLVVTTPTPESPGTDSGGSDFGDENVTTNSTTSSGGSISSSTVGAIVAALVALIGGGAGAGYLIKKCKVQGCNCCSCGNANIVNA